jgi:hypothetical protein
MAAGVSASGHCGGSLSACPTALLSRSGVSGFSSSLPSRAPL